MKGTGSSGKLIAMDLSPQTWLNHCGVVTVSLEPHPSSSSNGDSSPIVIGAVACSTRIVLCALPTLSSSHEWHRIYIRCPSSRVQYKATFLVESDVVSARNALDGLCSGDQRWIVSPLVARFAILMLDADEEDLPVSISWQRDIVLAELGEDVMVVSSPFGMLAPAALCHSVCRGIISSVIQYRDSIECYLTDARCLSGSEGGASFSTLDGRFVGVIARSLKRSDEHLVDLHPIIPAHSIRAWIAYTMKRMGLSVDAESSFRLQTSMYSLPRGLVSFGRAEKSLTAVRVGSTWASGVALSSRVLITNAHVFGSDWRCNPRVGIGYTPFVNLPLSHNHVRIEWVNAELVYLSKGVWDLAVLFIEDGGLIGILDSSSNQSLRLATQMEIESQEGREVIVMGFGLFQPSERTFFRPLLTRGTLSKVIVGSDGPVMLQTSAPVHRGNSGGMLLDLSGKLVLGIVTSNARYTLPILNQNDTAVRCVTIPRLNFAIPSTILRPIVDAVSLNTPNREFFRDQMRQFDTIDKDLVNLWELEPLEAITTPPVSKL